MSELSFLLELLLDHQLPEATKKRIADRIREVEQNLVARPTPAAPAYHGPYGIQATLPAAIQHQAPSTLALMAKHGDIPVPAPVMPPVEAPQPVAQVAQTPATAAAMNSRNEAINAALSGKVDKAAGRPRKW